MVLASADSTAQNRNLTWRGAPLAQTKSFLITECGYSFRLSQNSKPHWGDNRDFHLEWDIGWMRNVKPRWAVGATVYYSADDDGSRLAFKPRVRNWLSSSLALDLSAGTIIRTFSSLMDKAPGLVAGVALTYRDVCGITLTYEQIRFSYYTRLPGDEFAMTKGSERTLYAGLRLGSYPGSATGIAIPIALLIWYFANVED
jgi:hypothetical protein